MRLGLLSENGVQADGEFDALATGWQQRGIQRKCWRLWSVQRLQGTKHTLFSAGSVTGVALGGNWAEIEGIPANWERSPIKL